MCVRVCVYLYSNILNFERLKKIHLKHQINLCVALVSFRGIVYFFHIGVFALADIDGAFLFPKKYNGEFLFCFVLENVFFAHGSSPGQELEVSLAQGIRESFPLKLQPYALKFWNSVKECEIISSVIVWKFNRSPQK